MDLDSFNDDAAGPKHRTRRRFPKFSHLCGFCRAGSFHDRSAAESLYGISIESIGLTEIDSPASDESDSRLEEVYTNYALPRGEATDRIPPRLSSARSKPRTLESCQAHDDPTPDPCIQSPRQAAPESQENEANSRPFTQDTSIAHPQQNFSSLPGGEASQLPSSDSQNVELPTPSVSHSYNIRIPLVQVYPQNVEPLDQESSDEVSDLGINSPRQTSQIDTQPSVAHFFSAGPPTAASEQEATPDPSFPNLLAESDALLDSTCETPPYSTASVDVSAAANHLQQFAEAAVTAAPAKETNKKSMLAFLLPRTRATTPRSDTPGSVEPVQSVGAGAELTPEKAQAESKRDGPFTAMKKWRSRKSASKNSFASEGYVVPIQTAPVAIQNLPSFPSPEPAPLVSQSAKLPTQSPRVPPGRASSEVRRKAKQPRSGAASLITQIDQTKPGKPVGLPKIQIELPLAVDINPGPFLGCQRSVHKGKHTLVLDLDETLVHSSFVEVPNYQFIIPVEIDGVIHRIFVAKRPGVDQFLQAVAKKYEVIIFTASLAKYADPLMDELDPHNYCVERLFREKCTLWGNQYVKDLSKMGRELKKLLILDNSPNSYAFQPENAIPIESWFDDTSDTELLQLIPILDALAKVDDIPAAIRRSLYLS